MVVTKRVYEPATPSDSYRVLIDRVWLRGVSKVKTHLDVWEKRRTIRRTVHMVRTRPSEVVGVPAKLHAGVEGVCGR